MLQPSQEAGSRIEGSLKTISLGEHSVTLLYPERSEDKNIRLELMLMIAELAPTISSLSPEDKKLLERLDNQGFLFLLKEHLDERCTANPFIIEGIKIWVGAQLDRYSEDEIGETTDGTDGVDGDLLAGIVAVHSHEIHFVKDPFDLPGAAC